MRWVGLPYRDHGRGPDAYDCWGLVRAYLESEAGIRLPDYGDRYDTVARPVDVPVPGRWRLTVPPLRQHDVVLITWRGRPWHCGVVLPNGHVLHTMATTGSIIESVVTVVNQLRLRGSGCAIRDVYRHV